MAKWDEKMKQTNNPFKNQTISETLKSKDLRRTDEEKRYLSSLYKGKNYEEIYGIERANEERLKRSHKAPLHSEEGIDRIRKSRQGKKYEEIYGLDESKRIKEKYSKFMKETQQGKNNNNWIDGKSYEPYTKRFNNKFKHLIRKRDNYVCMKCSKHQEKEKRSLEVHHIDYDKKCSLPQNCITLCHKCNIEVNRNRKHWIKFFQSLLSEKYEYKYNEDMKIIMEIEENV